MQIHIKKLETNDLRFEAERLITTSFLHEWNEKEARESAEAPIGEAWGAFNGNDSMVCAVTTLRHGHLKILAFEIWCAIDYTVIQFERYQLTTAQVPC